MKATATKPPKQEVRQLLDRLPENASFEEIQYHIYVREKVARGLREVREGRTLSDRDVRLRFARWLEP